MQILFNLAPVTDSLYLPTAHLAQTDKDGTLTYMVYRATTVTCPSYGFELTPLLLRLLGIIDMLSIKEIEAKFKPPKAKNVTPLAGLMTDRDTKNAVETYYYRHLNTLLNEITQHGFPLALDAERKTLIKDVQLTFVQEPLVPHLAFKKTPEGVEYRFQLGTETQKWPISSRTVIPLTNTDPAWLIVDHALFKVPGINGNMVKPFRQKDALQIPPDKVRVYFRQFIAKSAGRNQIEAEGFEVHLSETLLRTRLEVVENILEKNWQIKPVFEYNGAEFMFGERRDHVTAVETSETSEEVIVRRVSRDQATEQARITYLQQRGLQENGRFLSPAEAPTLDDIIDWIAQYGSACTPDQGFDLVPPLIDGRTIALLSGSIAVQSTLQGDWFDVRGNITVGAFSFPFAALAAHIRRNDRFFPLPDGRFFLIPETWFARYSDIIQSGQVAPDGEGFLLAKALFTLIQNLDGDTTETPAELPIINPDLIDYQPSASLHATLRPYQVYGVKWLIGHYQHKFGACLADDMGLGKTLQTIAALLYMKEQRKIVPTAPATSDPVGQVDLFQAYREELSPLTALIIMPASLIFNWQRELARFVPDLFVNIHIGPKRSKDIRALAGFDLVLTTYQTARVDLGFLSKINWHCIVLDESQQIKNRESEVSKVVRSLVADHKISLSGTPIENSLADLWTQMEFINPATLGSYASFKKQFEVPVAKNNDAQARERLFTRVRPFFLRRTKDEVAPDLPALDEQVFLSEMVPAQRKRYDEVKSAMRNEILSLFDDPKTRLLAIQALTRLRQLANHPILTDPEYTDTSGKLDDVLAQWDTIQRSGHKVLFFSSFEQHLQVFRRVFEQNGTPYTWLTGDIATKDREAVVERFQTDPTVQAFFCTLGAGGVGLNLTAADYVFLLDPWWNPAREDQAIARAHRIGQTRPVTAIRFISHDTIEEKITVMQARKKLLSKELFAGEGSDMPDLTRADLEELLG